MSASNWEICPRCLARARFDHDQRVADVMALYGKVDMEEFDAQRAAIVEFDPETYRTLREDYEFYGAESGEVTASYSCRCSECALGTDFKESRRFYFQDEEELQRAAALAEKDGRDA